MVLETHERETLLLAVADEDDPEAASVATKFAFDTDHGEEISLRRR